MKAILYKLRLLEPVLVAQTGAGEENSAVALSSIPGSAIRGALAARWLAGHPGVDLAAAPEARAWFLDGTVCHLNAYPEDEGERALPLPAAWLTEKDRADDPTAPIYDLAVGSDPKLGALTSPSGGPFCRSGQETSDEAWLPIKHWAKTVGAARFDQVHIMLANVNRRGEGNLVFRYEALAAGQLFAGAIVAPGGTDLMPLKNLLESGDLLLGSAHLAGYGRCAIEACEIEEPWCEVTATSASSGDRLVVTLLSDVIMRGADGQAGWDGGRALAMALGCRDDTRPLATFGHMVMVGGYNRRWSLPIIQDWALAAGGVFVFARQSVDPAALQAALDSGVGERRAEGFGRIAADWQEANEMYRPSELPVSVVSIMLSPESKKAARMMVQRRLRLTLDRALMEKVNFNFGQLRAPLPENAQLSAIRQAITPGLAGGDMSHLIEHLTSLKRAGRSQLERCRLGNDTLYQWLLDRGKKLDVKEQLMGATALPTLAGETAALDDALRREYAARLIDGLMRQAAKRRKEVKQ